MSKGARDFFAIVINFLEVDWQLKDVTLELLEDNETSGQTLAKNLIDFLHVYGLRKNWFTC
jgi:hypothetical protein